MARYIVWWSTGRADGDSLYDDLASAESRFEDVIARPDIIEAEITDKDGNIVKRYDYGVTTTR